MCVKSQSPRQAKRGQDTKIPQSGGPPEKVGDEVVHNELGDRMERAATTASSLEAEKDSEGSAGFHQIVDFLNSTHIKYALTKNTTIYVSLIHQFWQTASASTSENGEMEITATINGGVKTVTEASIRRHLKLEDSDGISTLPNTEIFRQLALMGVDIPLFPIMLVQGLIFQGEGSTVPETELPQLSSPPQTNVADEAASTGVDVRHGGAATTVTSLDAGQGSGNINKTSSMPHDSPLLRGHTLGSDEGRMQQHELMDLVTKLSDRCEALETDLRQTKKVYGDDFIRLIKKVKKLEQTVKTSQARRRSRVVISDDAEEDLDDSSKHRRMIEEIDQNAGVTLVAPTHSQEDQPEDQLGVFSAAKVLADAAKNVYTYTRSRRNRIITQGLQQMMMVVPVEEVYIEALQKFDRDNLDKIWSLVKERFSSTDPTDDKERTLWVELKRLFEPDTDDIL
ncbi:hypothetical protein Tco_1210472 [Tanacetum coccineum]